MKKKLLSILLAASMVCCLVCLYVSPVAADSSPQTATLTIINGVDPYSGTVVVVNKKYTFNSGATFADLMNAASESGDIAGYNFSYGYIDSITSADGQTISAAADYSYYWSNYKNGTYASGYTDCIDADLLADGDCFQLAYVSYPSNIAPDWNSITTDQVSDVVAGSGEPVGTTMLRIVKGVDSWTGINTIVNKKYQFAEGATLGDLFAAAKSAGDIDDYAFSYGYINSITPAGQTAVTTPYDYSAYWANYKNGTYASGYTDCTETDLLIDGGSFEFSWEDYPAKVGLSETEWNELSAQAEAGGAVITPEDEYPSPAASSVTPAELSSGSEKIFKDLLASFTANAAGASDMTALCAAAMGQSATVDRSAAVSSALDAAKNPLGTNLQSSVLILTSLGMDVTSLDNGEGDTINLLNILADTSSAIGSWAESPAYTLLAYGANPGRGISDASANSPSALIVLLKDTYRCADGGYGWGGTSSPDTTGAVIAALSCYMNQDGVSSMISDAVSALKAMQNPDGGFGYSAGSDTNADSTALAIIGLCSIGIDPTGSEWTTASGANPLTALLSFANSEHTGLALPSGTNVAYAQSDAFRALAAYSGLRNTGKAFNIYTMAAYGKAAYIAPPEDPTKASESTTADSTGTVTTVTVPTTTASASTAATTARSTSSTTTASKTASTIKTGDSQLYIFWILLAVVSLATIGAVVIIRRKPDEK